MKRISIYCEILVTILFSVAFSSCSSEEIEQTVTLQVSEARNITHCTVTITGSYINNKFLGYNLAFGYLCSSTNTSPTLEDQDKVTGSLFMQDASSNLEPESGKSDFIIENLKPNQKYYYRLFFQNTASVNEIIYGDVKSFTTTEFKTWGTDSEPGKAIDLGLSVLWADRDLGASDPDSYGGCYRWGETEELPSFPEGNWPNKSYYENRLEKRVISNHTYWFFKPEYDAATVNWGGKWRMPTENECLELIHCNWSRINGAIYEVNGPNGNSIRMLRPYYIENSTLKENGFYLTSGYGYGAFNDLRIRGFGPFGDIKFSIVLTNPSCGYPIRPVQDKE